ncbi:hypothetical protein [Arthrobacter sp. DR-2P]|nr:hypothetical protein [Arthrobacter sp. DR-2P]
MDVIAFQNDPRFPYEANDPVGPELHRALAAVYNNGFHFCSPKNA